MHRQIQGFTLMELLIAVTLMGMIILGLSGILLFSNRHVWTAERRARVQNEISYVLDHMARQISRAIGNERVDGVNRVVRWGNSRLRVCVDGNGNGRREQPVANPLTVNEDHFITYRFVSQQVRYCQRCRSNNTCSVCLSGWENLTTTRILDFEVFKPVNPDATLQDNWVEVTITACWDPDGVPNACGTIDNPQIMMRHRIEMPSVSTN